MEEDSPAMTAGVQNADIVHALNGKEISSMNRYSAILQSLVKGSRVKLEVYRKNPYGTYVNVELNVLIKRKIERKEKTVYGVFPLTNYMRETVLTESTFCKQKQSAMTKNGKPYEKSDFTGQNRGVGWQNLGSGIHWESMILMHWIILDVVGDVTTFAGAMQLNIKRVRKAQEGEYDPADYLPVSENSTDDMYGQLLAMIKTVKNRYLSALLNKLFVEDKEFFEIFPRTFCGKKPSIMDLSVDWMEHTLSVTKTL